MNHGIQKTPFLFGGIKYKKNIKKQVDSAKEVIIMNHGIQKTPFLFGGISDAVL